MRLLRRDTSPPQADERPAAQADEPGPDGEAPVRQTSSGEAIPPVRDLEGGPGSPLEIGKAGWLNTFKRAGKKFGTDRCSMAAGSLAYHFFFALFPALVALLGVVHLLHLHENQVKHLVNGVDSALPAGAANVLNTAVNHAASGSGQGALTTVIIGVVLALWSATGGLVALQTALDVAYEVPQSAKFVKKRIRALILMLCTLVLGGLAAVCIVEGKPLGHAIEAHMPVHGFAFTLVWTIVRWAVTIILLALLFSCYYFFGPNRETPKWQWVSPGGVIGTVIFLAASFGFSFYISAFGSGSYSKTYGALPGVVLLIFWLYLTGIAIMAGAEVNAETERQAAAQAGHPGAQRSARAVERGAASPPPG